MLIFTKRKIIYYWILLQKVTFFTVKEITTFTFWTSLGLNVSEDPHLAFSSGWLGKTPFSLLDIASWANYSLIVFIIYSLIWPLKFSIHPLHVIGFLIQLANSL